MTNERDEYRSEVWYIEWMRGLPEGCISEDRIDEGYDCDVSPDSLVQGEVANRDSRRAEEDWEQDWPEEQD